jgi:hypothetical protein
VSRQQKPSRQVSVELKQAQAAVHLAVTIVQWFTTDTVTAR